MYRFSSRGACALLAVSLSACSVNVRVNTDSEADAIRALDAAWVAAVAAGDTDKVMAFYSDDAVFMPPNAPEMHGAEIRKEWASMKDMKDMHLSFTPTRIEVDGDGEMAIDVGTYEFSMTAPDGSKVQDRGKYAQVWEKHGGTWKCAVDIYNSSVPLPAPSPAAPAEPPKKKKNK